MNEIEKKMLLIKRNTEEIIGEEELKKLLINKEEIKHYIGYEISGKLHIGSAIVGMSKVKDLMDSGIKCSIFLADWHSWINDKLGGDIKKIKEIGAEYFKESFIASLKCIGGEPKKLKFVLGSELYHNNDEYWKLVVDVSKNTTLARVKKGITVMGRKEGEVIDFAKLLYPPMQVADIFAQGLNIAHAGIDQRKAHVIAREVGGKIKIKPLKNKKGEQIKPIAIHHKLVSGLGKPNKWPVKKEELKEVLSEMKMSKSKPETCIFLDDKPEDIKRKIKKAFCIEGETEYNPILNWVENLIFLNEKTTLVIKREKKYGGDVTYKNYKELEKEFKNKKVHPVDLKNSVAEYLIKLLEPARKHFEIGKAKKIRQEFEKII